MAISEHPNLTVGVLFPGELGSKLAMCFADEGVRVVTTLAGRSERTQQLCRGTGVQVLSDLQAVAECADIVFSVVTPGSAVEVAREVVICRRDGHQLVYVDLNSVGPETISRIEAITTSAGVDFVDAKFHGLASHLSDGAVMYLSGYGAERVADVLPRSIESQCLGSQAGAAATLKMLIGGLNKGLTALFVQLGVAASQAGCLDEFLHRARVYYPGVIDVVDRLVPTLPQHAHRRADEMHELAKTLQQLGLSAGFPQETARVFNLIGDADLVTQPLNRSFPELPMKELFRELAFAYTSPRKAFTAVTKAG